VSELKAALRARRWPVGPGIPEPAHVDPSRQVDPRVIAELVGAVRRRVPSEVEEPVHLSDWARRLTPELIRELDSVLKKYGM